jgi:cyclic pyranopterin phosphate synthase
MGIRKVRLTGGEPLVRKNSTELVSMISKISAIEELTMTTNATLLETHATELKAAGLKRINISLDTIDKERYKKITGGGDFDEVVRGIKAALDAGLTPVRVNTVILKGINDDQLPEIVDFANELGLTLRFIECMPMRDDLDWKAHYLSIEDVLKKPGMSERVDLSAVPRKGKAAAFFLPLKSGKGEVGFISPMSDRFCESCNRLRLTADGKIRSCLPTDLDVDIKDALKLGADDKRIEELIREAVLLKPELGEYNFGERERKRSMSEIGG